MLADDHPDRIQIAFDDHRLVNNAGLILPATLALHLGLPELVDRRLDLGDAPGRANTGAKIMTLVASALAGGDCIDDADVLRTGGTADRIRLCLRNHGMHSVHRLGPFPEAPQGLKTIWSPLHLTADALCVKSTGDLVMIGTEFEHRMHSSDEVLDRKPKLEERIDRQYDAVGIRGLGGHP